MQSNDTFVTIPPALRKVLGEPDEGTRIFRREGSCEECGVWFEAIAEHIGPAVSPGGVLMYAPVTRAAVHKRLKMGKMTAFLFHITRRETTFFGKEKKLKAQPYIYIPLDECKAWAAELKERLDRLGAQHEAQDSEEDREGKFLKVDPKDKGKKGVKYVVDLD